jgi:hypothetical protein
MTNFIAVKLHHINIVGLSRLTGGSGLADIAMRENITDNYVSNLIHLAWLSPGMVEAILDGHPQATIAARNLMLHRNVELIWENVASPATN